MVQQDLSTLLPYTKTEMTQTIQLRQDGEPSDQRTSFESPDIGTQAICSVWLANRVAESLDSTFIEAELDEEAEVMAELDRATKNYGVYNTPGDAVQGLYVSHDTLAEVFDTEVDEESVPESIGLTLRASDSDAFDEAEEESIDEEEVDALVEGGADSDETDDEEEEEVEIADEEVGLVDAE